MKKIYSIINVCGIAGRCEDNYAWYINVIDSVLNQIVNYEHNVIISACRSNIKILQRLKDHFNNQIFICYIADAIPVNTSFNYTVLETVKRFGVAVGYVYVDSGITLTNKNQLQNLIDLFLSGPYSMVSAMTDDDSGLDQWFSNKMPTGKDFFIIEPGKALNLHYQIFSHDLLSYYGRLLPDIFAGHCSESVLSFIAAAIKTNWIVSKKVIVSHRRDVDGQSSGFSPLQWIKQGKSRYDHPFIIRTILPRIAATIPYGGGFEGELCKHDPIWYDEHGFCRNPLLKEAIRDNLFLRDDEFDYKKINARWV